MALGVVALLAGLWAGLERIGWLLPFPGPILLAAHGPLMVSGFLGTLISVERAVAIREPWAFAAPLLSGLGALALVADTPAPVGPALITLGSLGLVCIFGRIVQRQLTWFTGIMTVAVLTWLGANIAWLAGAAVPFLVSSLTGFLVLTVVGERLELSRVAGGTRFRQVAIIAIVCVYVAAIVLAGFSRQAGQAIAGLTMVGLAAWLWRYDIARYTVRRAGLPRFIGLSLLAGYVWLGIGGVLWLVSGDAVAGPRYDAMLHTVFLGFVFSMVFAHAPIIFPAVLGGAVPYRAWCYSHVGLLNFSLVVRLLGDFGGWDRVRAWGGLAGAVAIVLFLFNSTSSAFAVQRQTARPAATLGDVNPRKNVPARAAARTKPSVEHEQ